MPFVLLIIGLILITAGVRNTVSGSDGLFSLVQGDFTGQNNFIYWFLSIVVIGSIGYIPKLKGLSTAFLALIILVLFLKTGNPNGTNGGFFAQFMSAIKGTQSVSSSATGTETPATLSPISSIPSLTSSDTAFV